MYESDQDDEVFEYQSDESLVTGEEDLNDEGESDNGLCRTSPEDDTVERSSIHSQSNRSPAKHSDVLDELKSSPAKSAKIGHRQQDKSLSLGSVSRNDEEDDNMWINEEDDSCGERSSFEHVAGPGCEHPHGYSGFEVTAEQMRGCTTLQCLVRKTPDWKSELDDQEFELSSDYFLSGLSDFMPSRDEGRPKFTPARHGAKYLMPDTAFLYDSDRNMEVRWSLRYYRGLR